MDVRWNKLIKDYVRLLVFNATFSYIVVGKTTNLTQSHWQTCVSLFQRLGSIIIRCLQRSRRTRGHGFLILYISYLENWSRLLYKEEFEDTKRGNHNISKKNRQHNGQKKKSTKHTYKNKTTLHKTKEKRTLH